MRLDLVHALEAVLQQAFVPLGVQRAGAGLERDLLGDRPHLAVAARLVSDVDGGGDAAAGPADGAADAAQRVEVVVHRGDADFDAVEVLVCHIDRRQHRAEHLVGAGRFAVQAIGEALALDEGVGEFVLVVPGTLADERVDVGVVGAVGIAEDPQRRFLDGAAVLGQVGQDVLPDEIPFQRLVGLGGQQRGFGQQLHLQRQEVTEDARQRDHHVDARPAERLRRISSAPASRP
jgi:hypothetical protein